ncbi:MAG: DUF1924 domain-containing protein [Hyphomicrobiales bacterium]|nr:DUF1924 domain-containing protein [Hyphomicrobiales bacterium]
MNNLNKTIFIATATILLGGVSISIVSANSARDAIIEGFVDEAGMEASAERGKILFESNIGDGKPDTPSCTTCHGATALKTGMTRAGKVIEPMAVSKNPERFIDLKKVSKWFRRNCKSVLGRECTPQEKADFLTYMKSK